MASRGKQQQGRSLSSLFSCCLKGSDQPEITYCHDNITTMTVLEPTLPMPSLQELDSMFTELVVSTQPQRKCFSVFSENCLFICALKDPQLLNSLLLIFFFPPLFSNSSRMNWTLQRSTEPPCLLCQQTKNGRSTVVRKW